ncbi:hypothetical protein BLA29_015084 [Euroglyphus maynei]|uniref:Uncharacterized protein n=1 Tax=Euroglyphus maynei TaxID=6958 RepID=A0A1Y3BQ08_EURMA|nr:hypothetical protein BLA29_015084 [Euroglyphus maynei]
MSLAIPVHTQIKVLIMDHVFVGPHKNVLVTVKIVVLPMMMRNMKPMMSCHRRKKINIKRMKTIMKMTRMK